MFHVFAILHTCSIGVAVIGVMNAISMQETFKVASCDDGAMIRKKQTAASDHCRKKRPLVAGADHDQAESIGRTEFRVLIERDFAKTWCFFVALSLFPKLRSS